MRQKRQLCRQAGGSLLRKTARGFSSFRAALDAEFQVKREGEQTAFILTCTKMKDVEEPKRRAYDLQSVKLFTDEEGEEIHSLAMRDVAREADERESEPLQ